jgi:hypothetical protein
MMSRWLSGAANAQGLSRMNQYKMFILEEWAAYMGGMLNV